MSSDPVLADRLASLLPTDVDYCSIRSMSERYEQIMVRNGVVEPVHSVDDSGVMVTVWSNGGSGYAATAGSSDAAILAAVTEAGRWAAISVGRFAGGAPVSTGSRGSYRTTVDRPWNTSSLAERIDQVKIATEQLRTDDRIVDAQTAITDRTINTVFVDTAGARIEQTQTQLMPDMRVIAHDAGQTQSRSLGGFSQMGQGGSEVLDRFGFGPAPQRLAEEALELLDAPNCPTDVRDIVLAPDQMVLQIHESIGHPLELDRILGDERNFAGTSFVTLDMFGSFRYGSDLLNVTFDPTVGGEMASYDFDDDGTPAERTHLIREGILERPLGGGSSQQRAGLDGVANSRSSSWNRPAIDRMANLNLEPGDSSFDELIGGIEKGIYLETNTSWSIDDSRNKFQFSCERGTLIEDGELTTTVRNPSYRGISSTFWRNLSGVGDESTFEVMGVANCGKGEPSQVIWVGHASPPCRFSDVEVFGAES
ncbi:MAG: TldD/PmbA family protein [Actinomycetia bacterium]|nr:TldD/PmbA family protein [Actinomycetes bacterium]